MQKKIIRFSYRKIVDAGSTLAWDKYVFESSYTEFLMQSQLYNREKKYSSFAEIVHHVPAAEKLHFLVSAAVTGYVQQLNGIIPGVLDNLGHYFLSFDNYRFEIINSDIKNKSQHKVAINFISQPMVWHYTIGNYMLVSEPGQATAGDGELAHLVEIQPFLNIHSLKPLE
jgi:hypothetical protein